MLQVQPREAYSIWRPQSSASSGDASSKDVSSNDCLSEDAFKHNEMAQSSFLIPFDHKKEEKYKP